MRLSWLLAIPAVIALAIQRRDADFDQVRTRMNKDLSGRRGDSSGKYFHESVFHPHYDGRFADRQLSYQQRKHALSNLMQTYLSTMADLGVETWLMHGTLLGWWWNRKIMPWDSDSDVQVSESSMHYLAAYYNMSVFHYQTPRIPDGRDYMMEINPHFINREQSDKMNVIDARWIDTASGLFIDITTARYNLTHPAGAGMISCKDGHEYRDTYIFPLRETYFEGVPAKIPFAYKELLEAEYRPKALTNTEFEGHKFDEDKMEWLPIKKQVDPPTPEEKKPEPPKPAEPAKPGEKKPDPPPQTNTNAQAQVPQTAKPQAAQAAPANAVPPSNPPPAAAPPANPGAQANPPAAEPLKPAPVIPKPPPAQIKFEDKLKKLEAKREITFLKTEEKRRVAEQKVIEKEEKKLDKLQKEEERRVTKEKAAEEKVTASKLVELLKTPEVKIVDVRSTGNERSSEKVPNAQLAAQ